MPNYIKIRPENIDKAAKIIADFCAEKLAAKGLPLAPALPPALPPVQSDDITPSQVSELLTDAEQAEIEAEIAQTMATLDTKADTAPLCLRGFRLLGAIHREELEAFNAKHRAEFEEYRTSGDKFIPQTAETENLAANAKAVHNQAAELWEQPLTKSRKRKRADQVAAATYRD